MPLRNLAMAASPEPSPELYDLVVRCVVAYEQGGEAALERELDGAAALAPRVREHVDSLLRSGLLQTPEQPESIGPYRVLQRLGTGGMGAVFLCEQHEPVRRQVAVKVLRAGMDSREILARFALERQALALLAHPGIAKVLDAGATPAGRPYLVMEYVPGLPLQRYCDEHRLGPRARLELFARVCDAVQHAHHKGIVHRDLKPSNVLVVERDALPCPVVIDFGVAKSMAAALGGGATRFTLPGAMLGTPEYMSPEQAAHETDVDTRTDVYSLGVILYELLTGTLPIGREEFRGGDVARVVGTLDPPTPSTRITALGAAAAPIAERRNLEVSALRRLLRGDLDWITIKALEKDRNRRYGTPAEVAADVRRHIASEPVSAGPPGAWYRLRKLCVRHRLEATAAMVVLLAVAAGLGASLLFWREAAASSRSAQANLDSALEAVGELVQVGDSDLVDVPHLVDVRRGLLARAVAFYEHFLESAAGPDAALLPRVVDARLRLGRMQALLGEHQTARNILSAALAQAGTLPGDRLPPESLARALLALAALHERRGDALAAEQSLAQAEPLLSAAHAAAPADPGPRALLVEILRGQGRLLAPRAGPAALAALQRAVALAEPGVGDTPEAGRLSLAIQAGTDHARQLLELGHRDAAMRELLRVRDLWQRAERGQPDAARDWRLATSAGDLAGLFARCDDYPRVLGMLAAAEAAYERLARDHQRVLAYRVGLATTRSNKALAQLRNWQMAEGVASTAQAEQDHRAALALASRDPTLLHNAAHAAVAVAQAHLEARSQRAPFDMQLARAARERAAELVTQLVALQGGAAMARRVQLEERRLFALLHEPPGAPAAVAALVSALATADALLAEEPGSVSIRERRLELQTRLGQAHRLAGDAALARDVLQSALAEQAALRAASPSADLWQQRRRNLLAELARAEAMLGQVAALLARAQEYLDLARNEDWNGRLEVARMLVECAKGPLAAHAERPGVLARAREVVQMALAAGAAFEASGREGADATMIAAMRARTYGLLVEIETTAGDLVARAAALGSVAACRAAARGDGHDARREESLLEACRAWVEALLPLRDAVAMAAACTRMSEWFAGSPGGIEFVAHSAGRFVGQVPGSAAQLRRFLPR
ncbi:MAG: serine/threonine protein kinase [Planctomycetes bacterium]|nr:serine/threonine protein kinase [Planctomycetota bacterium]